MAKQDEVDPTDESGTTAGRAAADNAAGSSTDPVATSAPADSGEPGGTPEEPVLVNRNGHRSSDGSAEPDDFDEIVRNSGVGETDEEGDDAKVLEPAGVATVARGGSTARKPVPARTPKGTPTAKRDQVARPERTTPVKFVRQSVGELRKVVYPTGQQLVNYFIVVLVFVLFVIAFVSLLDLGLGAAIFRIFR